MDPSPLAIAILFSVYFLIVSGTDEYQSPENAAMRKYKGVVKSITCLSNVYFIIGIY